MDNANNPEQVQHARTRLVRGANRRIDAGVLVIEGLETAQRNALNQDSRLGEAFEQRLLYLFAALLLMGSLRSAAKLSVAASYTT